MNPQPYIVEASSILQMQVAMKSIYATSLDIRYERGRFGKAGSPMIYN